MTSRTPTRARVGTLLFSITLALCACDDDATTPDPTGAAASEMPDDTTAPRDTDPPSAVTAPASGAGVVAGAELVCPAVLDTLALAAEAGWSSGAGLADDAVAASISAQLVIALVLDDPGETQALWDAVDAIADDGCPAETDQLTAIYGSTNLRDVLAAS